MARLTEGTLVPQFTGATAVGGEVTAAGLRGRPTLLQFHRFASCPACFINVHQFTQRVGELHDVGLNVVAFFYSTPEELAESFQELAPDFELVGDPDRLIFDRFGVERSHLKFLKPGSVATGVSGWLKGSKFQPIANLTQEDTAGVPADFIIDAEGIVMHAHYGKHGADSLSVDEVLDAYRMSKATYQK